MSGGDYRCGPLTGRGLGPTGLGLRGWVEVTGRGLRTTLPAPGSHTIWSQRLFVPLTLIVDPREFT